jgi:hypothetical protein
VEWWDAFHLVQRMAMRAAEVASEAVEAENLGNKAEKHVKLKSSDDEVIKVGEPLGDAGHELVDGKSVGSLLVAEVGGAIVEEFELLEGEAVEVVATEEFAAEAA